MLEIDLAATINVIARISGEQYPRRSARLSLRPQDERRRGDLHVVTCVDEFGPLHVQRHPGKRRVPVAAGKGDPASTRRRRARDKRPHGGRHLLAGYDLSTNRLYGHVKTQRGRTEFLAFCRYLRSLHPPDLRIMIVLDNSSPLLSTKNDPRVGELGRREQCRTRLVPCYASWLNRIEAQFQALRYFALDGTDHASYEEHARMIRSYINRRNRNAHNQQLRELAKRADVA